MTSAFEKGFAAVVAFGVLTGCRGCEESARQAPEASGPTMPVGLLAAPTDAQPRSGEVVSPAERLGIVRGPALPDGSVSGWVELQLARANDGPERSAFERGRRDSSFLSIDAMTLLHEPFARALPGFDLFLPHFFDGEALGRLVIELATWREQITAVSSVGAAKARLGAVSPLVAGLHDDAGWEAAQTTLLSTITALTALASDGIRERRGVWVLGM